jgi:hypothetical protein
MSKLDVLKKDLRAQSELQPSLQSVVATGYGLAIPVGLYSAVKLNILAASVTSGGTFKIWVSDQYEKPDFTAVLSATNRYYQSAVIPVGSTTADPLTDITISANGLTAYELNTNGVMWVCIELDARTDGTYSAWAKGYNL